MPNEERPEPGLDPGIGFPGQLLERLLQAQADGPASTFGADRIKPKFNESIVDAGGGGPR